MCADNVSSGIEPPYSLESRRLVHMPDGQAEIQQQDYALRQYGVRGRSAAEVSAQEHVEVLCRTQRYMDSAVSKTCNVNGARHGQTDPDTVSFEEFKQLYLQAYNGGAKGCTTFNINGNRQGIFVKEEAEQDGAACTIDAETGIRTCDG